MRIGGLLLLLGTAVASGACAHARTLQSWPDLAAQLRAGTPVTVVDDRGGEVNGRVAAISDRELDVDSRGTRQTFAAGSVREVRRNGDSNWNGLFIGAGIGAIGAMLPDSRCTIGETDCHDAQVAERVVFFGISTGLGVLIDAVHKDRSVVYRQRGAAVQIAPVVGRSGAAAVVSVRF